MEGAAVYFTEYSRLVVRAVFHVLLVRDGQPPSSKLKYAARFSS